MAAALEAGRHLVAGAALGVGLLTLYSMTKISNEAFWKAPPPGADPSAAARPVPLALLVPTAVLVAITLGMGVLADPAPYVRAVLGPEARP